MKLRIRGNSIRLRLGESEVTKLAGGGTVTDSTQFSAAPDSQLTYTLTTSPAETQIAARLLDREIRITVPESMAKAWGDSTEVGLAQQQKIDAETSLSILIEKDFRCLAPRPGEDESDTFANPAAKDHCKP